MNPNFGRETKVPKRGIEPTLSAYRPKALPLGQTGSQSLLLFVDGISVYNVSNWCEHICHSMRLCQCTCACRGRDGVLC